MDAGLRAAIGSRLRAGVVGARALAGGSISAAWAVELDDERSVFVKANASAPADMFAAEVRGLSWLAEGLLDEELCVPRVLACEPTFLVLELLEPGRPRADFDELLGRGLARLHRSGAGEGGFGLDHDNYIGSLPQTNEYCDDWPSFYRDRRLSPMLERAGDRLGGGVRRRLDRLMTGLEERCGDPEPPARLHGDLWGGNVHGDGGGRPVLIDPAVYAGHREVDLAMMRLFGGFTARVFAAYEEQWPLQDGWERRVDLYQLYPLLVHVVLFGGSYVGDVEAALRRLG